MSGFGYKIKHQISGEMRDLTIPEGEALIAADENWRWHREGKSLTDRASPLPDAGKRDASGFRQDVAPPQTLAAGPQVLASFTSYEDLIEALKRRCEAISLTREVMDLIAGFAGGYAGKLLGERRVKSLGPMSLPAILRATGTKLQLVEDPERTAEVKAEIEELRIDRRPAVEPRTKGREARP